MPSKYDVLLGIEIKTTFTAPLITRASMSRLNDKICLPLIARSSGLSAGAKAGIAITVLLLIGAGFGFGSWYFWRTKKGKLQFSHQSFDNPIHFSSKAYDLDG